jgi:NAD(P)-dependent dehydrogenase (short-subunit alcohol dehydrogenase family)
MKDLKKGIVVITGASSGIGKSSALLLDKMGYHVFAGVRNNTAAQNLSKASSHRLIPIMLDVTNSQHIQQAYELVSGHINEDMEMVALVNNAGFVESGPLEFITSERLKYQFDVNVIGPFSVTQKFLPLLRKSQGRIINTCSSAGFFSAPFFGPYSMSKYALTAYNDSLRRELRPWGIRVILLAPGSTETPIWDKTYSEMDQLINSLSDSDKNKYHNAITNGRRFMDKTGRSTAITPDQVAEKIARAVQDRFPKSIYFAGPDSYISFGIGRFIPSKVVDFVVSLILKGGFNRFF